MKKLHHIYFSTALLTLLAPAAGQSASFLPLHSTSFNIADSASLLKSKISLNSIGDASILRLDPKVLASEDDFFANNLVIKSANKTYPMVEKVKKVAAVCFINDTAACNGAEFGGNGDSDFDLNDRDRCYKEGYTVSDCPDGYKAGGKKCPYGPYYTDCVATCPSGYKTCEPPYYGVGEACGGKYASCEEDTERACEELDPEFTDTCQDGWKVDPSNSCKYDPTYGKCCNLCSGYDYTTIPNGYVQDGEACLDCNGQTKYKVKVNPCEGFQDCGSMGGAAGAETCQSGNTIKYDNCKPCPNLGTYTSCPSGSVCEYEDCSGLWYATGCKSGYTDYCDYCAM